MGMKIIAGTVEVPAGTYFLGDPCYAVPDSEWDGLLARTGFFRDSPVGTLIDGAEVVVFHPDGGDNTQDQHGKMYAADAGLIGLVPATDSARAQIALYTKSPSREVTFDGPVLATTNVAGTEFSFGPFCLTTEWRED